MPPRDDFEVIDFNSKIKGEFMKNKISTFVKSFWKAIYIVGFLFAGLQVSAETVLKVIPHADLKNIDPIWTTAYITRNHGYMVYDTLFAMDANLKPQPQMVGSWDVSGDKLTWTFTRRSGLKWHDGADAVSYAHLRAPEADD